MIQSLSELVSYIDHTLLKPDATPDEIRKLCHQASEHSFRAVCINPGYVELAASELAGTGVLLAVVIGFPLGATTTKMKAMEAAEAVASGAEELDMVINIGRLKAGEYDYVRRDIAEVVETSKGKPVKVIIETSLLTEEEKVKACNLAVEAGAAFVKTSTGFSAGGATIADVRLMREVVGDKAGVKASGGIRDLSALRGMVTAGASRIGTSSGMKIVAEYTSQTGRA